MPAEASRDPYADGNSSGHMGPGSRDTRASALVSLGSDGATPQVVTLSPIQMSARLAWRPRLLDFTAAPLSEIVAADCVLATNTSSVPVTAIASELRPELETTDRFLSIERFSSLSEEGKLLSLSFWRDEDSVRRWRENLHHRERRTFEQLRQF